VSTQYNELSGRSVDRLRALADGVFAIAMTLLVLDLRLPESGAVDDHELWSQLIGLGPQFAAFLLSFTMLGTFWLAEHTFLDRCTSSDRTLAWICVLFLFFVSTLPFSASTLAEHVDLAVAVGLYWANLAGLGATLAWQLWHVQRARMVDDRESITLVRRRLVLAQGMYAAAALVSLASPQWSIVALGVVQLFFVVSPRLPFRV
jgi:TMEM175 potassium channel family protein